MIDVLLNGALPEAERHGIPEWPARVREARGEQPERGWVRMSREDYAAHRARYEQAQVAWLEAHPPPPPPPEPVPASVPLSDFLWAAWKAGVLSGEEAIAAARTGDIPASMEAAVLAGADAEDATEIRLMWAAMYEAERASPFWALVEAKTGGAINGDVLDAVFRMAAARRNAISGGR